MASICARSPRASALDMCQSYLTHSLAYQRAFSPAVLFAFRPPMNSLISRVAVNALRLAAVLPFGFDFVHKLSSYVCIGRG